MRSLAIIGLALFVCSCGKSASSTTDAPGLADAADDAAAGSDAPCGAAGPAQMVCGGACVDTSSDPQHCGDCTTSCTGATSSCAGGTCVTPLSTSWEHHYGGDDFGYYVGAVAVDGAGNTYVTGTIRSTVDLGGGPLTSAGSIDIVVASFDPAGGHRWSRRFGSTGADNGSAIAIDGSKVYVTGFFSGTVDFGGGNLTSAGLDDAFVLTLSEETGAYVAARRFGTAGSDTGAGAVVDGSGNVTVCGFFGTGTLDLGGGHMITGAGELNAFVASAAADGSHRWSRVLSGTTPGTFSGCFALAIDGAGNVTTVGDFAGSTDLGAGTVTSVGNADAFVASYTSTGAPRWSRVFGNVQDDAAAAVATDAAGNVMVGGDFHLAVDFGAGAITSQGVTDGFLVMLEAATGTTRFARQLGASQFSAVRALHADPSGNFVATGVFDGTADLGTGTLQSLGGTDVLLAGFDAVAGTARFAKLYGGSDRDEAGAVAVTSGGAMVVSGYFTGMVDLGLGPISGGPKDNAFVMMVAP